MIGSHKPRRIAEIGAGFPTLLAAAAGPVNGSGEVLASLGGGRPVQWATCQWMRADVRRPLGGLDDLVWRSVVGAARKPFGMQVLPPVLTMRMDDASGPIEWLYTAIGFGCKPWVFGWPTSTKTAAPR